MDAILNVGLEMGSHNQDCWPHIFRYTLRGQGTSGQGSIIDHLLIPLLSFLNLFLFLSLCLRVSEYVSSLEHTHFSDGSSQPTMTITQAQQAVDLGLELSGEACGEATELGLSQPVIQPLSIQELLRESSRGKGVDARSGSLMTGTSAAKAVCSLSTQADRRTLRSAHFVGH